MAHIPTVGVYRIRIYIPGCLAHCKTASEKATGLAYRNYLVTAPTATLARLNLRHWGRCTDDPVAACGAFSSVGRTRKHVESIPEFVVVERG